MGSGAKAYQVLDIGILRLALFVAWVVAWLYLAAGRVNIGVKVLV